MPLLNRPHLRLRHEFFHVDRILKPEGDAPKRQHRVIAVMPAYNAERTLAATLADMPAGCGRRGHPGGRRQHGPHRARWPARWA